MTTGIIDVQFPVEDGKAASVIGRLGKMTKKVRIKAHVETLDGKDKKKKKIRRQGYPNLTQAHRWREMDNDSDDDSIDEDDGILPMIEGFDPRKKKAEEIPEMRTTRPGICNDCKKKGLTSADEYMQMTFKKYDSKDVQSNGHCIVCQSQGSNFNFLDSNAGSATMTYPRDFYDKFSREIKPINIDSDAEQSSGSPMLPSVQEESKSYTAKVDPLGSPCENVLLAARKGVLGRLSTESPARKETVNSRYYAHSPGRDMIGKQTLDSDRKGSPARYSPYLEKLKKDKIRRELQYPDTPKKEILSRQFYFDSPKLDLTGHGDIRNLSKKDLEYRKDLKFSASFEPSKHRPFVNKGERYMNNFALPPLNTYSFEPQEVTDEAEDLYFNKGLKGGAIRKDPNPLRRERQELLQKQDKYSLYSVGSLGLVYGLPEHNHSLNDRSSVPESTSSMSMERASPASRPLSLLLPMKPKKRPFSYFSYG